MSLNPDLFLAILAMDAYNRGYGAGISAQAALRPGSRLEKMGSEKMGSE
jgi:hypothetical protein